MKLSLSCADFAFPMVKHEQSLELIAMLGSKAVDIGMFEGRSHLWPSREFSSLAKSSRALRRKLEDRGLVAADVFLQISHDFMAYAPNHPEPRRRRKSRDWFERTLEYACACNARHVSTLPGAYFDMEGRADSFHRCCEELAWRVERAARANMPFGVEAHIGSIVPRPRDAMRLLKKVPGLSLTLDYTHFTYLGIDDAQVEPLLSHASHFHCRGGRKGRIQCSFADNRIDYKRIAQKLSTMGYNGHVCIEYVWIDWEHCNETDNLSETVLFRDLLRSV